MQPMANVVFAEAAAPLLQIAHAILAVASVGAATHLALWLRGHRVGRPRRHAATRRFAALSAGLCLATFVVGLVIYPTYRTRVRAEYLDEPAIVARDHEQRQRARDEVAGRHGVEPMAGAPTPETTRMQTRRAVLLSRWFDVKEHWAAIFTLSSIAIYMLLRGWRRAGKSDADTSTELANSTVGAIAFWAAVLTAAGLWACALIGLFVANARSI